MKFTIQKEETLGLGYSGSKMYAIINEPWNVYEHLVNGKPLLYPTKKINQKLQAGHFAEDNILRWFEEKENLKVNQIKQTLISNENSEFTANIDGFLGESIENVDTIIEVKNMEMDKQPDLDSYQKQAENHIDKWYIWQIHWYMYILRVKKAKFLFCVNGFYYGTYDIVGNDDLFKRLLTAVRKLQNAVQNKEPIPLPVTSGKDKIVNEISLIPNDAIAELALTEGIRYVWNEEKKLKKLKADYVKQLKTAMQPGDVYTNDNVKISLTESKKKGGVDWGLMIEKEKIDVSKYEKDDIIVVTLRVTPKKPKELK